MRLGNHDYFSSARLTLVKDGAIPLRCVRTNSFYNWLTINSMKSSLLGLYRVEIPGECVYHSLP